MDFDWVDAVILVHVIAAVAWAGGAFFVAAVVGPAMMKAGPNAGGFLTAAARNGGFSRFFMAAGVVTIVAGGILYSKFEIHKDPWGQVVPGNLWLTLGAILAVLAFLDGLFVIMPKDKEMGKILTSLKGPPTPQQSARIQELGMKIGKMSAISTVLVLLALVGMMLRRLV